MRVDILVSDLRGNAFSFSPLSMMLAMGLSYMVIITLRYVPSVPISLWVFFFFYHKWILNFVKSFFWLYLDYHMVFTFNLLMWYITLICRYLTILHPLMNPTWSWYTWVFQCITQFGWLIFLSRSLASVFISDIGLQFCVCFVLISGWCWPHRMSSQVFLPIQFLNIVWEG